MASNFWLFLIITAAYLSAEVAGYDIEEELYSEDKWCFYYTWNAENSIINNCTGLIPCVKSQYIGENSPNTTQLWEDTELKYLCEASSGNSCIKYTYSYDGKMVNTSSFCGKVIEDGVLPVLTGCYQQNLRGYLIEMCVCQPLSSQEPCNASPDIVKYPGSSLIVLAVLSVLVRFA